MNITEVFIRRPVMTTLIMLGIVLFGVAGYRTLPVSDLPNVDFPTLQVYANLPGASPETIAASVATPLERQFTTIPGLDSMTSTSARGNTSITLQFSLDRSLDAAAQDVQSAIAAALRRLPPGMPNPPTFRKVNPNIIVRSKIMAIQAGLTEKDGISTRSLEAHYLAGGNHVLQVAKHKLRPSPALQLARAAPCRRPPHVIIEGNGSRHVSSPEIRFCLIAPD